MDTVVLNKLSNSERERLLTLARSRLTRQVTTASIIQLADRSQPLPLSWAQQRLWFLDQLDPTAGAAYHMPMALRLSGQLDRVALQATLNRVVDRHESLRTIFVSVAGSPRQVIAPLGTGVALREEDLSALNEAEQSSILAARSASEAVDRFDLEAGPLIRGRLIRLAEDEHVLMVTQHHIVSDGWSIGVMVKEFATLYAAFAQGQPDPLPALPIQYPDYAAWQRHWLQGEARQAQLDYWRQHLSGAPALLDLPTDRPRPAVQTYAGDHVERRLAPPLVEGIRALSLRHGTTLFMTALAIWSVLLSRLSGQTDVVVGSPVANRQRTEFEPLVGFFVNTLALRVKMDDDPDVATLFAQVKATTLAAYAHQDLPFEQVVEALQPERSLGHSPIFQVMLSLNNTPGSGPMRLPGLALSNVETGKPAAKFDLALSLSESADALVASLVYATDLFDRPTIERLLDSWEVLVVGMVADETRNVSSLPLLSPLARQQLLGCNVPVVAALPVGLVHAGFEAQAARRPQAIAVSFEDKQLSYGELNTRANQVAHRLIACGVGPDDRVAICVERGLEMLVGVLAILKAGAGYVPLDPVYPAERLGYMLQDCAPVAVLTQTALQASLPLLSEPQWPVLLLDALSEEAAGETENPTVPGLGTQHLAYVIYTSGSTGQPKGVMVEHGHVSRLFAATQEQFGFNEKDVWTLFHSFAFDFSVWEIWGALLYGGRLVVVPSLCTRMPLEFYDLLVSEQVTVLNQTPSAFRGLIAAQQQRSSEHHLRVVVFGGEALELSMLAPWLERNDSDRTQLVNMYGITEITVHATYRRITEADVRSPRGSPIGQAIADLQLYVLDSAGEPTPIGVTGELYVGGAGVVRGYLHRPELTAARFLQNPFHAGARLYRTGDLGRRLSDGSLEYLGRNDFQVKIRGFRIELGEIEARLSACEGVREAVVIAREDSPGDKRLVAYLVASPDGAPDAAALRLKLQQDLPEYMLPSAFVRLAAMPLTANGKLDRQSLPAPDHTAVATQEYQAPEGEVEQAIATIWQDLLGLEKVGRHDHFFVLGGHSLMIVSLVERLHRHGFSVDVRTVFMAPVLSVLAAKLAAVGTVSAPIAIAVNRIPGDGTALRPEHLTLVDLTQPEIDSIVARVPGGHANVQDIYPLAALQSGILFHHLLEAEGDAYLNRMVATFDSHDRLERFLWALQRVIDRHDILRTAVHWQRLDKPVQVVHRHVVLPVTEVDLRPDVPALRQLLQRTDPRRLRLDLQQAPLLAAHTCLDPVSGEWILALVKHHIIDDNQSLKLLLREIQLLLEDKEHLLPKPVPYRNFIAQLQAVPDEVHEAYFRRELGDITAPTAPFGLIDVQRSGGEVSDARRQLEADLCIRLRDSARKHGVTAAVLFHVAWARVLSACSNTQDVVFGTVLSGRQQAAQDVDQVVGIFINTLPIRIRLGSDSVADAVLATHQGLSELLAHEQASLSLAQRCSGVQLPLPLFTTLLNYRHTRPTAADSTVAGWPGMRMLSGEGRTNYPVTVSIDDMGQDFSVAVECVPGIDPGNMVTLLHTALLALVDALTAAPQWPVCSLQVLSPTVRHALITGMNPVFNSALASLPFVHVMFESQAARRPNATALRHAAGSMPYGELNAMANRLAHHLRDLGVGVGDRVAVSLPRGPDFVLALLAVLKAGAAYVPLDPSYPPERLAHMLCNSKPRALLLATDHPTWLAAAEPLPVLVDLNSDAWRACSELDIDPVRIGMAPNDLAYVIYTSGSTGQPKGVMVEHAGVVNQINAFADYVQLAPTDRVLQFAALSFDTAVEEIFATLAHGATLVLREDDWLAGASMFWSRCADEQINVVDLPAQFFSQIALERATVPTCIRSVVVGGEAISEAALQAWFTNDTYRPVLLNTYGPTEATVSVTAHAMTAASGNSRVLGRPIANARLYVLDARQQLVPPGAVGELHIGGCQVARGYLDRPDQTAARFIPDPFLEGGRLYATGDLVRWQQDGTLEYMGRNDFQVKIRGFRIEPSEVEARIVELVGVEEALVVAQPAAGGELRLVGYYTGSAAASDVRVALQQALPAYMVPAAMLNLPAWPTTPNGKIDRAALQPVADESFVRERFEAPRGSAEQAVAQLWSELLQVSSIGRHDSFFDLGGHSLLAIRMMSQLGSRHGWEVSIRQIFETPTVAGLAAVLAAECNTQHSLLVELKSGSPDAGAIYCIPGAGGRTSSFGDFASKLSSPYALYGLQPRGMHDEEVPAHRVRDMAAEYLQAIDANPGGPCVALVGHSLGGMVAFEIARRIAARGGARPHVLLLDAPPPIGTAAGRPPDDVDALLAYAHALSPLPLAIDPGALRALPPRHQVRQLLQRLHREPGVVDDAEVDMTLRIVGVYLAHLQAAHEYLPDGGYDGHIVYIAPLGSLHEGGCWAHTHWQALHADVLPLYLVQGDHQSMLKSPFATQLAAATVLGLRDAAAARALQAAIESGLSGPVQAQASARGAHAARDRGYRRYRQRDVLAMWLAAELQRQEAVCVVDIGTGGDGAGASGLVPANLEYVHWNLLDASIVEGAPSAPPVATADVMLALGNGMAYLTPAALEGALGQMMGVLKPGGMLICDLINADAITAAVQPGVRVAPAESGEPGVAVFSERVADERRQLLRLRMTLAGETEFIHELVALQAYGVHEACELFRRVGYVRVRVTDLAGNAFDPASPGYVLIAERKS